MGIHTDHDMWDESPSIKGYDVPCWWFELAEKAIKNHLLSVQLSHHLNHENRVVLHIKAIDANKNPYKVVYTEMCLPNNEQACYRFKAFLDNLDKQQKEASEDE